MTKAEPEKDIHIHDLYPGLSESQLEEAEENLQRYLDWTLRMYERILSNPEAYAEFKRFLVKEKTNNRGDREAAGRN